MSRTTSNQRQHLDDHITEGMLRAMLGLQHLDEPATVGAVANHLNERTPLKDRTEEMVRIHLKSCCGHGLVHQTPTGDNGSYHYRLSHEGERTLDRILNGGDS